MDPYKTRLTINLQATRLQYFAVEDTETVIRRLMSGHPMLVQTYFGHYVIVNPEQVPAIEVEAIVGADE